MQDEISKIISDLSLMKSVEPYFYSNFFIISKRKWKVLGTDLSIVLNTNYNMSGGFYSYRLTFANSLGHVCPLEDYFDRIPNELSNWIIFNIDLIRVRNVNNTMAVREEDRYI